MVNNTENGFWSICRFKTPVPLRRGGRLLVRKQSRRPPSAVDLFQPRERIKILKSLKRQILIKHSFEILKMFKFFKKKCENDEKRLGTVKNDYERLKTVKNS